MSTTLFCVKVSGEFDRCGATEDHDGDDRKRRSETCETTALRKQSVSDDELLTCELQGNQTTREENK
jgi:hypothetical protein